MPGAIGPAHQLKAELIDTRLAEREADETPSMCRHEVDRIRRRHLRRNDQVPLILAILVINQDKHATVAGLFNDFFNRDQCRAIIV